MDKIKGNFGFGFMRLPMAGEEVDLEQTCRMVDRFLEMGFNYFDTAHGYLSGKSERAIKSCLTSRHPREAYILTDKLSDGFFEKEEDIRPLFQSQLEICGVDYFDFYLMHAQNAARFEKFKACRAYETVFALKEEGLIRHVGISFHDTADVLDKILTEYPQIEVVQLQLNYADWDDPAIQSGKCWQVCRDHGKPILVMEPVKGGRLADLPPAANQVFEDLHGGSPASYAIRYVAGQEGIRVVLSGMSTLEQVEENTAFMAGFRPLNDAERAAVDRVKVILRQDDLIPCTSCRYCVDGCPQGISIPDLFACMNAKHRCNDPIAGFYYKEVHTRGRGKASDCIGCGQCEAACPQHLEIRALLKEVAQTFETE